VEQPLSTVRATRVPRRGRRGTRPDNGRSLSSSSTPDRTSSTRTRRARLHCIARFAPGVPRPFVVSSSAALGWTRLTAGSAPPLSSWLPIRPARAERRERVPSSKRSSSSFSNTEPILATGLRRDTSRWTRTNLVEQCRTARLDVDIDLCRSTRGRTICTCWVSNTPTSVERVGSRSVARHETHWVSGTHPAPKRRRTSVFGWCQEAECTTM
jgi:hypothetical protein